MNVAIIQSSGNHTTKYTIHIGWQNKSLKLIEIHLTIHIPSDVRKSILVEWVFLVAAAATAVTSSIDYACTTEKGSEINHIFSHLVKY